LNTSRDGDSTTSLGSLHQSAAVAAGEKESGFSSQIMKKQKPSPVSGHGILTEQMAQLLLHERERI